MYDVLFSSILLKDDIIHNTLLCHHYQGAHTTKYFLIYCSLMSAKLSFSSCIGGQDFSLITSKPTSQPHQKIEIISTTDQTRLRLKVFCFQFSVSSPSPRPRVKCCGWDREWGTGGRSIPQVQISLYTYSQHPTEPRVLRKVCVVVEVPEIIRGGSRDYMVCKPILVFSLSLSQAEQLL